MAGDTVNLHAERNSGSVTGGPRLVEVIKNGEVVASASVDADGRPHELKFDVEVDQSSWIAVRQFPQLHTNPVNVIVDEQPIRCSHRSALWCAESVRLLWSNRRRFIAKQEQPTARIAYAAALEKYFDIAKQAAGNADIVHRFELE